MQVSIKCDVYDCADGPYGFRPVTKSFEPVMLLVIRPTTESRLSFCAIRFRLSDEQRTQFSSGKRPRVSESKSQNCSAKIGAAI